jgi:hypothetical protein
MAVAVNPPPIIANLKPMILHYYLPTILGNLDHSCPPFLWWVRHSFIKLYQSVITIGESKDIFGKIELLTVAGYHNIPVALDFTDTQYISKVQILKFFSPN